jgi:hypothetical protein
MWRTRAGMLAVVREMERGGVSVAEAAAFLRHMLQRRAWDCLKAGGRPAVPAP